MTSDSVRTRVIEDRGLWLTVAIAALLGIGVTAIQIAEKIAILANPGGSLFCDVSAVINCSDVLTHWQSSALGVPNSFVGAVLLAVIGSAALGVLLHTVPSPAYVATLWGLAIFFLCFITWYLEQNAFAIGALCLWCSACATVVTIISWALTRIGARAHAFGHGGFGRTLERWVHASLDIIVFAGWWLILATMLVVGLYL